MMGTGMLVPLAGAVLSAVELTAADEAGTTEVVDDLFHVSTVRS